MLESFFNKLATAAPSQRSVGATAATVDREDHQVTEPLEGAQAKTTFRIPKKELLEGRGGAGMCPPPPM